MSSNPPPPMSASRKLADLRCVVLARMGSRPLVAVVDLFFLRVRVHGVHVMCQVFRRYEMVRGIANLQKLRLA